MAGYRVMSSNSRMVLRISARSASVSGLIPPRPSRTSKDSASILRATEDVAASAPTCAVPCHAVTSIVRSCPAREPSPAVRTDQHATRVRAEPIITGGDHHDTSLDLVRLRALPRAYLGCAGQWAAPSSSEILRAAPRTMSRTPSLTGQSVVGQDNADCADGDTVHAEDRSCDARFAEYGLIFLFRQCCAGDGGELGAQLASVGDRVTVMLRCDSARIRSASVGRNPSSAFPSALA
jgi:hypothetical protein